MASSKEATCPAPTAAVPARRLPPLRLFLLRFPAPVGQALTHTSATVPVPSKSGRSQSLSALGAMPVSQSRSLFAPSFRYWTVLVP